MRPPSPQQPLELLPKGHDSGENDKNYCQPGSLPSRKLPIRAHRDRNSPHEERQRIPQKNPVVNPF
jgi:hypothetical protein